MAGSWVLVLVLGKKAVPGAGKKKRPGEAPQHVREDAGVRFSRPPMAGKSFIRGQIKRRPVTR
jgi:hypothetical protein